MIRQLLNVPKGVYVACSGGPDSMAVLDFLNTSGKVKGALYFDHKTDQSEEFSSVVKKFCIDNSLEYASATVTGSPKDESLEAYWSKQRNNFFRTIDGPVVTGHHLDDAVEWWIFSSLHGEGKLIPRIRGNYLRPFLLTRKEKLLEYCNYNNLPFYIDETNLLSDRPRVLIRNKMMYDCLEINPGLHKTVKKKYLKEIEDERQGW